MKTMLYWDEQKKFDAAFAPSASQRLWYINTLSGMSGVSKRKPSFQTFAYRLGPARAKKALVCISGTHGVEGYGGSLAQRAWAECFIWKPLPPDTAAYFIFALNAYGMACARRVDTGNVDVNRNGAVYSVPRNRTYATLAPLINPEEWTPEHAQALRTEVAKHPEIIRGIARGQSEYPEGLFYSGRGRCWSIRILESLAKQELFAAEHLAVVDFHTGLGEYGFTELICPWPEDSAEFRRAKQWYNGRSVRSPISGTSVSGMVSGDILNYLAHLLPESTVTAVAPEFGTFSMVDGFMAMAEENWQFHRSHFRSDTACQIAQQTLFNHFFPQDQPRNASWRALVQTAGQDIIQNAIAGLAQS
jgi:hypothetical protein